MKQGTLRSMTAANMKILVYLLHELRCMNAYSKADKGTRVTNDKWRLEKAKYAAQLDFNDELRWIDLYNELRQALINNDEVGP